MSQNPFLHPCPRTFPQREIMCSPKNKYLQGWNLNTPLFSLRKHSCYNDCFNVSPELSSSFWPSTHRPRSIYTRHNGRMAHAYYVVGGAWPIYLPTLHQNLNYHTNYRPQMVWTCQRIFFRGILEDPTSVHPTPPESTRIPLSGTAQKQLRWGRHWAPGLTWTWWPHIPPC